MRNVPGFLPYLQSQLHSLDRDQLCRINDPLGLDLSNLINQVVNPRDHTVYEATEVDTGVVASNIEALDTNTSVGREAFASGDIAFCILANEGGVVNALSKIPNVGTSLLAIKLLQSQESRHVWVMTSPSNHEEIRSHLNEISGRGDVRLFQQFESVRLTPDNQLYLQDGEPSFYSCGSGDVIPALRRSGLLEEFLSGGGKHIFVVDVRNVTAEPDAAVVGSHINSRAVVTCEVTKRLQEDSGGILCNHMGFDQIIDQFRFSSRTDASGLEWISTGSYVIKADLDFSEIKWPWHRLKKECDGQLVVQHERVLHDLTAFFQTRYIAVSREERFMSVKSLSDLEDVSRIFRKI